MEIEFYGANCLKLKTKEVTILVDDNLTKLGGKTQVSKDNVLVYTNLMLKDETAAEKSRLVIDAAGEYEVGDVTVSGVQTRGHMDEEGSETATVYQFTYGNQTATVLGHIHPNLSDEVQELIGGTDVLFIPVGGNGYTLDATGAASVIKKSEPDVVIPTAYETKGLTNEVPLAPLEEFLKVSSMTADEPIDSFKLGKSTEGDASQTKLVILSAK